MPSYVAGRDIKFRPQRPDDSLHLTLQVRGEELERRTGATAVRAQAIKLRTIARKGALGVPQGC